MKKTIAVLSITLLLMACSQPMPQPTSSPTIRVFLPKVTDSLPQTPGPTRTPRPTSTPEPTPISASPLDPDGPWLLHIVPISDGEGYYHLAITNFDGSGHLEIHPRLHSRFFHYSVTHPNSRAGAKLAIRVYDPEMASADGTAQPTEIWIISIPDGETVRKIPLVDEQVKPIISQHTPEPMIGFSGVDSVLDMAPFEWSPNGRYLAFSAAIDGPSADIYFYDSAEDSIHRLTDGPHQAVFTAWSPDSRWIVHEAAYYYFLPLRTVESTWAVSIDGHITRLDLGPENLDKIVGWLTDTSMFVYDVAFEGASSSLRTLNLLTGKSAILFEGPFHSAAYDPLTNTHLINMQVIMVAPPTEDEIGIYQLDQYSKTIKMLIPGNTLWVKWEENLMQFSGYNFDDQTTLVFNSFGEITCVIPEYENDFLFAPNGSYFLVSNTKSHSLFTKNCVFVSRIEGSGSLLWLSDSSGFIHYLEDGNYSEENLETHPIYLYALENDWIPILLNPDAAIPGFDGVIYH